MGSSTIKTGEMKKHSKQHENMNFSLTKKKSKMGTRNQNLTTKSPQDWQSHGEDSPHHTHPHTTTLPFPPKKGENAKPSRRTPNQPPKHSTIPLKQPIKHEISPQTTRSAKPTKPHLKQHPQKNPPKKKNPGSTYPPQLRLRFLHPHRPEEEPR